MNEKKNWRMGKKSKCFPTKSRKNKGNIAALRQKKKLDLVVSYNDTPEDNASTIIACSSSKQPLVTSQRNVPITTNMNDTEDLALPLDLNQSGNLADVKLEGRRIVDINYIFNSIKLISHNPLECTFKNLIFTHKIRNGCISSFYFKCNICSQKEVIHSEEPSNRFNTNIAIVTAVVNTGQGHAQIEELGATINMPVMSNNKYQLLHNEIATYFHEISWEEIELAGKEETRIAIENKDVDANGKPMIAVIADGAWSKRSYKTKYNALSGVACIIGAKTKKVLFIGVRNKYCCICQRASKNNIDPKEHLCFKNWNLPSTAMEADIIVEGFKRSIDMHNLIYSQLIGDGDSSVMKRLYLAKPYGYDFVIKKIECSNHILRNYVNKLKDISIKRRTTRGINVPGYIRQAIKDRTLRLRYAITEAVKYRKNHEYISYKHKLLNLKKDIINGPSHVFGDHTNCLSYFCKGRKDGEINLVPQIKSLGIWEELVAAKSFVLFHAESLLYKVTKFIGGKRVNFSLRGSYNLRCNAAVTSYNAGPRRLHLLHKKIAKQSPGLFTKKFISKSSSKSNQRNKRRLFNPPVYKKTISGPDEHYGATADIKTSPDMPNHEYEVKKILFLSKLNVTQEQIEQIEKGISCIILNKIRSNKMHAWSGIYIKKKRLTASVFGNICKLRSTTSRAKTVSNILYGSFCGNDATKYGIQNEENAKYALSDILNKPIRSSGLIIDHELPFLAASPDGLIGEDSLVEIKCPISAKDILPEYAISTRKIKSCEIINGKLQLKRTDSYYYQVHGATPHLKKKVLLFLYLDFSWHPL
ncbi:hypothetical protein QTP88_000509 [Uroleucon formosanum]